jgi:REP element-mobilizing transposase RayT
MKSNLPLLPDTFYHIYNRGINGENLFKEERNYGYFLNKYAIFIEPVVETYAYCLLKNHFHLLIKIKNIDTLNQFLKEQNNNYELKSGLHHPDFIVSKQFAKLFSSYSQSINISTNRTGSLFETPFKRIEVKDENYFIRLIWYIHHNPQKHGFVSDFRDYPHSSYNSYLSCKNTKLKKNEVIEWFGNLTNYKKFHSENQNYLDIADLITEF